MSDLISRQAAIDALKRAEAITRAFGYHNVIEMIRELPTSEKMGKWKISDLPKGQMKYCSECGFGQYIADVRTYRYCPNCGARMEE